MGHKILSPSSYGDYDKEAVYPLCFVPDQKVSLQDVMEPLRNRYEGTEYSPDETGKTNIRVIGTDIAMSVHILQVYPELPAEMSCITWESTAPALYGVFIPVSNAALSISEPYSLNQGAETVGIFDTEHYPFYRFKELNTLGVEKDDYKVYGLPVRSYWHEAETIMTQEIPEILKNAAAMEDSAVAAQYITDYCNAMQNQAFEDAGRLLNDVRWYHSKNSNTMKNGRNPETDELLDELRVLDPLKITLDPSVYHFVPDVPSQDTETIS